MKQTVCSQCGGRRDGGTLLCRSCYQKGWDARRKPRTCSICGQQKTRFSTETTCSTCYHRTRFHEKSKEACRRCGLMRGLYAKGLCPPCYKYVRYEKAPKAVCGQCGRKRALYCKGVCRPCYTNNVKRRGKYGLEPGEYVEMVKDQRGLCAICDRPMTRHPHVDHSHETGEIRGLLCYTCNVGLGSFGDDPERLRAAAKYVEAHRARKVA